MMHARRVRAVVVVALLATPLLWTGDRAHAIQDSEDKVWFGPVGLAIGEGARLNVFGIGNPDTAPWTFVVRIFDRQGDVVQAGKFQVAPGAIGSFEIIGNPNERTAISVVPVRRTFRAEIVGFNPQPDPPGRWVATMEIYSLLTGRTSILIGNPEVQPPPERDSRAGQ